MWTRIPYDTSRQTPAAFHHAKVQTDLTASDIEVMADYKEKLENKTHLKRDLSIKDVCKNDQTVRFYTGIPSLACLLWCSTF